MEGGCQGEATTWTPRPRTRGHFPKTQPPPGPRPQSRTPESGVARTRATLNKTSGARRHGCRQPCAGPGTPARGNEGGRGGHLRKTVKRRAPRGLWSGCGCVGCGTKKRTGKNFKEPSDEEGRRKKVGVGRRGGPGRPLGAGGGWVVRGWNVGAVRRDVSEQRIRRLGGRPGSQGFGAWRQPGGEILLGRGSGVGGFEVSVGEIGSGPLSEDLASADIGIEGGGDVRWGKEGT